MKYDQSNKQNLRQQQNPSKNDAFVSQQPRVVQERFTQLDQLSFRSIPQNDNVGQRSSIHIATPKRLKNNPFSWDICLQKIRRHKRIMFWGISFILALLTARLTTAAIQQAQETILAYGETASVVVANHDLTPGTKISASDISTQIWPLGLIRHDVVSFEEVIGQTVTQLILEKEAIPNKKLYPENLSDLALQTPQGYRAVSLEKQSWTGALEPGTHVDLLGIIDSPQSLSTTSTTTLSTYSKRLQPSLTSTSTTTSTTPVSPTSSSQIPTTTIQQTDTIPTLAQPVVLKNKEMFQQSFRLQNRQEQKSLLSNYGVVLKHDDSTTIVAIEEESVYEVLEALQLGPVYIVVIGFGK